MRLPARPSVLPAAKSSWFRIPANWRWADGAREPMGMDLSARAAECVGCCCMRHLRLMPAMERYWVLLMPRYGNRDKGVVTPQALESNSGARSPQRWLSVTAQAGTVLSTARSITVISDRESDIYEHFARRPANVELIVRASWNRKIEPQSGASAQLFAFVDSLPEAARFSVKIPAAPGRKERTADL